MKNKDSNNFGKSVLPMLEVKKRINDDFFVFGSSFFDNNNSLIKRLTKNLNTNNFLIK